MVIIVIFINVAILCIRLVNLKQLLIFVQITTPIESVVVNSGQQFQALTIDVQFVTNNILVLIVKFHS